MKLAQQQLCAALHPAGHAAAAQLAARAAGEWAAGSRSALAGKMRRVKTEGCELSTAGEPWPSRQKQGRFGLLQRLQARPWDPPAWSRPPASSELKRGDGAIHANPSPQTTLLLAISRCQHAPWGPPHLLRLLALLVGDMKAARARLAAAVPPPALRLLPGAARGAGGRSRTPWLFSDSPARGKGQARRGVLIQAARQVSGSPRPRQTPQGLCVSGQVQPSMPHAPCMNHDSRALTQQLARCGQRRLRAGQPGMLHALDAHTQTKSSPSSLPTVTISSCCWGGSARMACTLALPAPMPPAPRCVCVWWVVGGGGWGRDHTETASSWLMARENR